MIVGGFFINCEKAYPHLRNDQQTIKNKKPCISLKII